MFRWVRKFSTIYSVQRKFLVTFRWIVSRTSVRRTIKGCKFSLLSHFAAAHSITVPLSVFIFHVNYNFWIDILISFCATHVTFSNCVTMEGKHIEKRRKVEELPIFVASFSSVIVLVSFRIFVANKNWCPSQLVEVINEEEQEPVCVLISDYDEFNNLFAKLYWLYSTQLSLFREDVVMERVYCVRSVNKCASLKSSKAALPIGNRILEKYNQ